MSKQILPAIPPEMMQLRDATPNDKAFIYATWLRGLYYGNSWFTAIDKDAYMESYHKVLDILFSKPTVSTVVACLSEDPDVVLGYAVMEPGVLHWVFVKQAWRRFGIAKKLIPKDITLTTHLTQIGDKLKPTDWKFNPFKL